MHGQKTTHRRINSPHFFTEQGIAHVVHAGATVLRLNRTRQEPQFAHAFHQAQGELSLLVGLPRHRCHLLRSELSGSRLDTLLLLCKLKVHVLPRETTRPRRSLPYPLSRSTPHPGKSVKPRRAPPPDNKRRRRTCAPRPAA